MGWLHTPLNLFAGRVIRNYYCCLASTWCIPVHAKHVCRAMHLLPFYANTSFSKYKNLGLLFTSYLLCFMLAPLEEQHEPTDHPSTLLPTHPHLREKCTNPLTHSYPSHPPPHPTPTTHPFHSNKSTLHITKISKRYRSTHNRTKAGTNAVLSACPIEHHLKFRSRGRSHRCGRCGASRCCQAGLPHHSCHGGAAHRLLCIGEVRS